MSKESSMVAPVLFFLFGAVMIAESFLIPPSSDDYARRWLVALVGLMLLAVGALLWQKKHRDRFSEEANEIIGVSLSIVVLAVFSTLFLAGGFVFGDEITGGIPYLSDETNNLLGRILFGTVGGFTALVTIFRSITLVQFILRVIRDRQ